MLHPDAVDLVTRSYQRARRPELARDFYDRFMAADDEVQRQFAHTDFERQRELFLHGVFVLIDYARGNALGKLAIQRLVRSHAPMRIPDRLYGLWLSCLLEVLAQHDPQWTPQLRAEWRSVLAPGMALLRAA